MKGNLKDIGIGGVYVIHALKGYEIHEKRVSDLFKKNDIDFEFVTDGDPSVATLETYKMYFTDTIDSILSVGVKSCTLNHILAYKRMVERNQAYAIIFENDPFFLGNFTEDISNIFEEVKSLEQGFLISLENTTLKHPSYWQTKRKTNLYKGKKGRAAGAYIIDLVAAKTILADLEQNKCPTVIDWWHNLLIERNIVDMYWAHPPITEQGSHNGEMSSTISTNKQSISRKLKWRCQKKYHTYIARLVNNNDIIE